MRPLLPAAAFAGALALCVSAMAAPAANPFEAQVARGHDLARAKCSSCHAVERDGASPSRRAPAFRAISGRYVELTLHRRLTEISETGHYDMPPMPARSDEVGDLVAYINSLPPPE
jgi:mono/diheme cytochrome c family protein